MTQEDRQLLLKDLCARLPYGVKFKADNEECIREIHYIRDEDVYIREYSNLPYWIDTIKPYLRPMSSMTEDEKDELYDWGWDVNGDDIYSAGSTDANNVYQTYQKDLREVRWLIDWLNAHHFDYRGLIEKGLALEAKEEMYD